MVTPRAQWTNISSSNGYKAELGRACIMRKSDEKCTQHFGWKILREETIWKTAFRWEDNAKIDLTETGWNVDRIQLAQDTYQCCVLVNMGCHD
jgi:hypothetical protein